MGSKGSQSSSSSQSHILTYRGYGNTGSKGSQSSRSTQSHILTIQGAMEIRVARVVRVAALFKVIFSHTGGYGNTGSKGSQSSSSSQSHILTYRGLWKYG